MGFLFGHGGGYKKAEKNWREYEAKAEAEYRNQANLGINNTAYQQALAAERDLLKNSLAQTAATSAITGASPAAQALAKQQASQAIAESTARMGANISQDRNNAMTSYLNATRQAKEGISNALIAESQAQSQALSGLITAGTNLASSGIGLLKK